MQRKLGILCGVIFLSTGMPLMHGTAHAASATIANVSPAATVPPGATVTFNIVPSEFTNPTYTVVDSFHGGATSNNVNTGGFFSWTPNKDDVGTHTLTATVSDAQNTKTVTQVITVQGPASLKIKSLKPGASTNIGVTVTFTVEPFGLFQPTYVSADSFSGSSLHTDATKPSGEFSWIPLAQDVGVHTITIRGSDIYGNATSTPVNITVLPQPTASFTNLKPGTSVSAGEEFSFSATSTGFIAPRYTVATKSNVGTSSITVDISGVGHFTPSANDVGTHVLTLTATDDLRTKSATLSLFVQPGPAKTVEIPKTTSVATPSPDQKTPASATSAPLKTTAVEKNTRAASNSSTGKATQAVPAKPVSSAARPLAQPSKEDGATRLTSSATSELMDFKSGETFVGYISRQFQNFFSSIFSKF